MKIAVAVAGFTPGEADELRRVMSSTWRKGERMDKLKTRLLRGMQEFGIAPQYAERIYKTVEGFGAYGFPESHAASFALLTSASCYIKCYYPDVFTCALLNSEPLGFYSPRTLIADAQRHGVRILDCDVNHSNDDYTLTSTPLELRVGLRALYGVAKIERDKIVEARTQGGPFASLADLVKRTQLKRSVILRLAAAGCFASLGLAPREALWEVLRLPVQFDGHWGDLVWDEPASTTTALPTLTPWEKVQSDYQALGFSVSLHPLGVLRPLLSPSLTNAQTLNLKKPGSRIRVVGLVSVRQRPPTAGGTVFLTLEDEHGFINVIIPRWVYEPYRMVVISEQLLEIEGRLELRDGVHQLQAEKVFAVKLDFQNTQDTLALKSRDFH
jgi:DNA polymerase-3 subunit alpha/error-prone DNA polymerase